MIEGLYIYLRNMSAARKGVSGNNWETKFTIHSPLNSIFLSKHISNVRLPGPDSRICR